MSEYGDFLAAKQIAAPVVGIPDPGPMPAFLKPFQADCTLWALRRGRAALFQGTGLGKTIQQLVWARKVADHTRGRILLLAPLAVAHQTVGEAEKFGIDGVAYAKDQNDARTDIVVTNYDRFDKFDTAEYTGIVLDESSIVKAVDSKTRAILIERCQDIHYRLCCTATPAPNDYVELGNHAEFLGVMSQKEMLSMWFVHDGSGKATNKNNKGSKPSAEWRLKRHAERRYWEWVASWAVMIRRPSDLGYDDEGYILPPLTKHQVTVPVEYASSVDTGMLFPVEAKTLQERQGARRSSIDSRVRKAAEIVAREPDKPWLIWCGLNAEGYALAEAIPGLVNVEGSDTSEFKQEMSIGFTKGKPLQMSSKLEILGFGMNYQNCSRMIFVGLNDSWERLFQGIRRCWRFGQTEPVHAYLITSELEGAVVANLEAKEAAYEKMMDGMAEHMVDLCRREVRGGRVATAMEDAAMEMILPAWLVGSPA